MYRRTITVSPDGTPDHVSLAWPLYAHRRLINAWHYSFIIAGAMRIDSHEFATWMLEHCRSAVVQHRTAPDPDNAKLRIDLVIPNQDQAYHFRTRWT